METEFIKILNELYPFNYGVCGEYNEDISRIYDRFLKFKKYKFGSNSTLNNCHIPKGWEPVQALIYDLAGAW